MPDAKRITPAELTVVREHLGLTPEWLADYLGVSARNVRHWEAGKHQIPGGIRQRVEDLERQAGEFASGVIDQLANEPDPVVQVYRSDDAYCAAHPGMLLSARWHRAAIARVAQKIPTLSIVYTPIPAAVQTHRP
jgi:transcriptional regulator with XRE-family HTH domain